MKRRNKVGTLIRLIDRGLQSSASAGNRPCRHIRTTPSNPAGPLLPRMQTDHPTERFVLKLR